MKKINMMFIIIIMTFFMGVGAFTIFSKDILFSADENRYLAGKPDISIERILSKDFQSNMEKFLSDQIPFRNQLMVSATVIRKSTGIKNINDAYIGKNGFYFEKITDNDIHKKRFKKNLKFIKSFIQDYENIEFRVMLVPGAGNILSQYLPKAARVYNYDRLAEEVKNTFGSEKVIELEKSLKDGAKEYHMFANTEMYYKTDHHWTAFGAYIGYKQFSKSHCRKAKNFTIQKLTDNFYGTLYSKVMDIKKEGDIIYAPSDLAQVKVDNGEKITDSIYDMEKKKVKDKYQIFWGGNFGQVNITTKNTKGKHLLVLKDSFANSFVPYILDDYDTITMVDLRYFAGNLNLLIKEKKITEMLLLYEMSNFASDNNIYKILL